MKSWTDSRMPNRPAEAGRPAARRMMTATRVCRSPQVMTGGCCSTVTRGAKPSQSAERWGSQSPTCSLRLRLRNCLKPRRNAETVDDPRAPSPLRTQHLKRHSPRCSSRWDALLMHDGCIATRPGNWWESSADGISPMDERRSALSVESAPVGSWRGCRSRDRCTV